MRGASIGTPAEARTPSIVSSLDHIGDDAAECRGELEAVSAPPGRDDDSFAGGVRIDEKIPIDGVTIEADTTPENLSLIHI